LFGRCGWKWRRGGAERVASLAESQMMKGTFLVKAQFIQRLGMLMRMPT